jgi:hypothetical protein
MRRRREERTNTAHITRPHSLTRSAIGTVFVYGLGDERCTMAVGGYGTVIVYGLGTVCGTVLRKIVFDCTRLHRKFLTVAVSHVNFIIIVWELRCMQLYHDQSGHRVDIGHVSTLS